MQHQVTKTTVLTANVTKPHGKQQIVRTAAPIQPQPQQQTPVSGAPSSLIKSLLANKVTTTTGPMLVPQSPTKGGTQQMMMTMQPPQKTPFFTNPTNTNNSSERAVQSQPPAGAVAAASVIMSSVVAAQSARPATASVPISNSSKLMQVGSPNKPQLIGAGQQHPPLVLSSPASSTINPPPNVIASNAMNVRQVKMRR